MCISFAALALVVVGACTESSVKTPPTAPRPTPGGPTFQAGNPLNNDGSCFAADVYKAGFLQQLKDSLGNQSLASGGCTSQDIKIATADIDSVSINGGPFVVFNPGSPISCKENDQLSLVLNAHVKETATSERTDIGIWVSNDAGNARTGVCRQFNLVNGTANVSNVDNDQCGDMNNAQETIVKMGTIDAICKTSGLDTSRFVHVGSCLGWTQPGTGGDDRTCPTTAHRAGIVTDAAFDPFRLGTTPGTTSKCNCDGFDVPILVNKVATIELVKSCVPSSDPGTFDMQIDNSVGTPAPGFGTARTCTGPTNTTGPQEVAAGTNQAPGADHLAKETNFSLGSSSYTSTVSCTRTPQGGSTTTIIASQSYTDGTNLTLHVNPNDAVKCTFVNTRKPTLTIVKRVINNNGGTATVDAFGITTDKGSLTFDAGVDDGADTKKYTSNTITLSGATTASLHEDDVTGYTEGTWACTGVVGAVNSNRNTGSVVIGAGEQAVCTITNDDQGSTLQIVKKVINDNGGTATVGAFGITTTAGSLTFDAGSLSGSTTTYTSTALGVNVGTKTLHESDIAGYTEGSWSCTGAAGAVNSNFNTGSVAIGLGETVVCTIENNDQPASLQIVKKVINDNGGTATVGAFGITTTAGALTFDAGSLSGSTTTYTATALTGLSAGSKTLHENDIAGYAEGSWSCTGAAGAVNSNFNTGSVVLGNGETVVCTIENNDSPSSLQIVKKVINDNGGTATVGAFGITTTAGSLTFDAGSLSGSTTTYTSGTLAVGAGTKTLHENDISGYAEGSWSCTGAAGAVNSNFSTGSVAIANGETVVCTIENDDQPASLQIVKKVINDNGGTATVGAFGITTTAGSLTFDAGSLSGSTTTYTSTALTGLSAGSKTLHENDISGYAEGSWSCTGAAGAVNSNFSTGSVVLANGETVVCTIENNDQAPSLTIVKRIVNNSGGTATVSAFGITTTAGALTFGSGVADGANTLKYTATTLTGLTTGSKTLHENDVAFYTEGSWSCTGAAGAVNTNFANGSVVLGLGESVTCTITNDDDTRFRSQIAPTNTTCEAFSAGTSSTLAELLATVKNGTINTVSPGVFFYYAQLTKTAGQVVSFAQTVNPNPASLPLYDVQQGQAFLYTVSGGVCSKVATLTLSGGTWSGGGSLAAGDYVLGVKFSPDAAKGLSTNGITAANALLATHNYSLVIGGVGAGGDASVNTRIKP